jgi:hypothetical protein
VSVVVADLILVGPMKAMLPLTFIAIIFSTIVLSSGCQKKTAATNPKSQSETELRDNTKPLQAADLIGYDGTKLRKSVDRIKEANDKHNQEAEKMVETGPDQ